MIARAAQWNPSVFRYSFASPAHPIYTAVCGYMQEGGATYSGPSSKGVPSIGKHLLEVRPLQTENSILIFEAVYF